MPDETDPDKPGRARDERAQAAAAHAVDTERLLPGEAAASEPMLPGRHLQAGYRDDAKHWIGVYAELLDFKRFMIDGTAKRAAAMRTELAQQEIESTDLRLARAEAERFTRRLAFWRGRLDLLDEG